MLKGSSGPSHFNFEINVGKRRIDLKNKMAWVLTTLKIWKFVLFWQFSVTAIEVRIATFSGSANQMKELNLPSICLKLQLLISFLAAGEKNGRSWSRFHPWLCCWRRFGKIRCCWNGNGFLQFRYRFIDGNFYFGLYHRKNLIFRIFRTDFSTRFFDRFFRKVYSKILILGTKLKTLKKIFQKAKLLILQR